MAINLQIFPVQGKKTQTKQDLEINVKTSAVINFKN